MKRFLPLLLVVLLLLSACSAPAENPSASSTQESSTMETTTIPTSSTNDATENQQPVVPLNYTNPLNGQPMAEPYTGRPVAIMLNNIKAAMPQHGVSQADILYEVLAEGGITRCMGIFSDVTAVEKVGSIRSARKYYVQLAQGYQALYVHFGGSSEALNYLKSIRWQDMDGMLGDACFFQDKGRLNKGYSSEHTWFAKGPGLLEYAKKLNYTTSYDKEQSYNMNFDDGRIIVGDSVNKVTVYFNQGGKPGNYTKSTAFTYDANTKNYFAAQHGGNYIDGNTNKTVSFRNVVVLRATTYQQSNSTLMTINTVGSGTGYFSCNGQTVAIKWSRASTDVPFTFTLENGNPLTFGVGTTYIGIVPTNATVDF